MAYFPNGTAGDVLTQQCDNCLHGMNDGIMCPVADVQMTCNYTQLKPGNDVLLAAMNMLINEQGECQMKAAIEKAGIKIDLSERDQLPLLDLVCTCRKSDAWRCAIDQNLPNTIACTCSCHRSNK